MTRALFIVCSALTLLIAGSSPALADLDKQSKQWTKNSEGKLIVRFSAKIQPNLPVAVRPLKRGQWTKRGIPQKVTYRFTNLSKEPQRIKAIHQLEPDIDGDHFSKLACFCFEEQILKPFETKDMPVIYTVAQSLPADIDTVMLNYVVFPLNDRPKNIGKSGKTPANAGG